MKRSELVFSAILVPVDYLMILVSGLVAYRLRFSEIATLRPVVYELPLREYFSILLIVGVVWVVVFIFSGLYAIQSTRRFLDEFVKIILGCSTGVLLIILLIFFQRELFSSRFIILGGWVLAMVFVSLGRLVVRNIQHSLFRRGYGLRNVVLIGIGETADHISELFRYNLNLGYSVVEKIKQVDDQSLNQLREMFRTKSVDEVILADPGVGREERMRLLDVCNDSHVGFKYAADLLDAKISNIRIETVAGRPLIEIKRTALDGWGRISKRVADTIISLVALIILSPFFLVIAVLIKLDSPGQVFVELDRVGEGSKPFRLFKFRSMVKDAHAMKKELMKYNERRDGPLFKMKNDPRITRFGRFIRRTSIDELPQLINVLKGQMSLVGPRPHEPEEVSRYRHDYRKLLAIKPGITGFAQISGRSDLSFDDEARLDIYYIEHWSPLLDIKIILRTPLVVLSTKSAS
ncbi:MAG: sugar transferase [Patescibacteria group bacterium]|nr:sugar transferase [Patescibacteria group bacterium]